MAKKDKSNGVSKDDELINKINEKDPNVTRIQPDAETDEEAIERAIAERDLEDPDERNF